MPCISSILILSLVYISKKDASPVFGKATEYPLKDYLRIFSWILDDKVRSEREDPGRPGKIWEGTRCSETGSFGKGRAKTAELHRGKIGKALPNAVLKESGHKF